MLPARLERNLFPEFSPDVAAVEAAPTVAQDAELSRLSDALVRRIGRFLRGHEFARLAQTSKVRPLDQSAAGEQDGAWLTGLCRCVRDCTGCVTTASCGTDSSAPVNSALWTSWNGRGRH